MARLHLIIALLTLAAFIGTGVFIKVNVAEIIEQGDAVRFQYRANHILILMAGLMHLLLWRSNQAPCGWVLGRRLGSAAALLAVPILLIAFYIEPPRGIADRPITASGVIILSIGIVMSVLRGRRQKIKENPQPH